MVAPEVTQARGLLTHAERLLEAAPVGDLMIHVLVATSVSLLGKSARAMVQVPAPLLVYQK